jgi:hypothetical protein
MNIKDELKKTVLYATNPYFIEKLRKGILERFRRTVCQPNNKAANDQT